MSEYVSVRPKRIRGHPGVWATQVADGTYTIYTQLGIYKMGVESEERAKKILAQVKLRIKEGK